MMIAPIGHIYNDMKEKFGLPRQSGLADHLISRIVMEPEYRVEDAFRGLTDYERIWILWRFDGENGHWSPTVRPPKLGGNERMGVFATRSPNRPNHIGLTCVRLVDYTWTAAEGPVLTVAGADLRDGTPILDIKPYLPYADSYPDAAAGFAQGVDREPLEVVFMVPMPEALSEDQRLALEEILALDPRPGYQRDPDRIYGMSYGAYNVSFRVDGRTVIVTEIRHDFT